MLWFNSETVVYGIGEVSSFILACQVSTALPANEQIPTIQPASLMDGGFAIAHASCWVKLNSTSVETERMNGPCLPGSYVVGMMM